MLWKRSPILFCRRTVNSPLSKKRSEPYQQILAVFNADGSAMRAKDVCHALGIGIAPKDTGGIRAKLNDWSTDRSWPRHNPAYSPLTRTDVTSRTAFDAVVTITKYMIDGERLGRGVITVAGTP